MFRAISRYFSINERVWIGANDIEEEGNFTWVDEVAGTPENIFWFSNTDVSEPNGGTRENCVEIYTTEPFFNNDQSCSDLLQAICGKLLSL